QRHDRWTITPAAADISLDVPKSAGSMVQKKWDILSEDDGHTLEYASIEGEEFTSSAEDLTMLRTLMFVVVVAGTSAPVSAQWFKYPTPGAPRTPSGEVDLSAATPQLANGKPDFSGVWMTADPACGRVGGPVSVSQLLQVAPPSVKCPVRGPTMSREGINMGVDLPGGLPYQPWLAALVQERIATLAKDDPHIRCLPDLFLRAYGLPHNLKFVHTPNLLVMLNEFNGV